MSGDPLSTDSAVYQDAAKMDIAKRYVDDIKWFYNTMTEQGNSYNNVYRPKVTITRFAYGAPRCALRQILDILTDMSPVVDPVMSQDIIPGKYKVEKTYWKRDQPYMKVGPDPTVTIVQDLTPDYGEDGLAIGTGGSCDHYEETEYHWDEAEVKEVSPPFPQGITYSVGGISKDKESGLFDYYITKSVAVEQYIPPYTSSESLTTITTSEEYRNAYDTKGWEEGIYTDDSGTVQVNIDKNRDCTYNLKKVVTKKKEAMIASEADDKSLGIATHSIITEGNKEKIGDAPEEKDGVYEKHSYKKEDDGTYTNSVEVNTEREVEGYRKSREASLRGIRTTVSNLNVGEENTDEPDIGESISTERTKGGKWTETIVKWVKNIVPDLAKEWTKTLFNNKASVTKLVEPEDALPEQSNVSMGDGRYLTRSNRKTDEGMVQTTEETIEELGVSDKRVAVEARLGYTVKTIENVQQQDPAPYDNLSLGSAVSNDKTQGGLYNQTLTVVEPSPIDKTEERWRKVYTSEVHVLSNTVAKGKELAEQSRVAIGDGKYFDRTNKLNQFGLVETSEATTSEVSRDDIAKQEAQSYHTDTVVTESKSKETKVALPSFTTGEKYTVQNSVTDGGRYDTRVVHESAKKSAFEITFSKRNRSKTTILVFRNQEFSYVTSSAGAGYSNGQVMLNEFGLYDGTMSKTTTYDRKGNATTTDNVKVGETAGLVVARGKPSMVTVPGTSGAGQASVCQESGRIEVEGTIYGSRDDVKERMNRYEAVYCGVGYYYSVLTKIQQLQNGATNYGFTIGAYTCTILAKAKGKRFGGKLGRVWKFDSEFGAKDLRFNGSNTDPSTIAKEVK